MASIEGGFEFFQLPPELVAQFWSALQPKLKSGIDRSSGKLTEDALFHFLATGQWQCWCFYERAKLLAAIVTCIRTSAAGLKVLEAIIATGDDRDKWQRIAVDRLKEFGRLEECGLFEMWARPGWERVFPEFKKTHVLLEFKL